MIFRNARVFWEGKFTKTSIRTDPNGYISAIGAMNDYDEPQYDCSGNYIIPGLVDIHTHGCIGYDFSSASPEEIHTMQRYYLKNGITAVLPTTVTLPDEDIRQAAANIRTAAAQETEGADILGMNMEGPYLSPAKCGAHNAALLKAPDLPFVQSLGSVVKIVNVAPEYEGAMDFIREYSGTVSIAHTDCDYETAMQAISLGANHITHIFNAMNGLHHRKPGVIGAFFDSDATAEIIGDTLHVAPPVLRMLFAAKADKLAVISDSMEATGLHDGEYTLGNLQVTVKNSVATLADGTLAGSTMNLFQMMQKLIAIGIAPEKAVKSVTQIPADSIGAGSRYGRIAPSRKADFVLLNSDFSLNTVIHGGKFIQA